MIEYFKKLLETLVKIEKHLERVNKCIDNDNYRRRYSVMIGHWND